MLHLLRFAAVSELWGANSKIWHALCRCAPSLSLPNRCFLAFPEKGRKRDG